MRDENSRRKVKASGCGAKKNKIVGSRVSSGGATLCGEVIQIRESGYICGDVEERLVAV